MNAAAPRPQVPLAARTIAALLCGCLLPASLAVASPPANKLAPRAQGSPALHREAIHKMGKAALYFEPNQGQADPSVRFIAKGGGFTVYLTGTEAIFVNSNTRTPVRLQFLGAAAGGKVEPGAAIPGISNYLFGQDASKWRTRIPHYTSVRIHEIYPGIAVNFYSNGGRLEYDLEVAPGADPSQVALAWEGIDRIRVEQESGDLVISTSAGDLRQRRPTVYQEIDGSRVAVAASYRAEGKNRYGFELAQWDPKAPLIIDPLLAYSTYLGAAELDEVSAIASDFGGSTYVVGYTRSTGFPLIRPLQNTLQGQNTSDTFITKLSFDGNFVLYSTYIGGEQEDRAQAVAVDSTGSAYITGLTSSFSFPVTANTALQSQYSGTQDAFLLRLGPNGDQITYGTFLGNTDTSEVGNAIALDPGNNIIFAGTTNSFGLPVTPDAFDRTYSGNVDGFVIKLNPAGQLVFCTYIGGTGEDAATGLALDPGGNIFVVGGTLSPDFPTTEGAFDRTTQDTSEAYVLKLSQNGKRLFFSTLLGGPGPDNAFGIALEPGGRILIAGQAGTGFPTTANAHRSTVGGVVDGFVARINSTGTALLASSLIGTASTDFSVRVKPAGGNQIAVMGYTDSNNFPATSDAFGVSGNTSGDVFFTVLQPLANALVFSSILRGTSTEFPRDLGVDAFGSYYILGATYSSDFQTVPGSLDTTYGGNGDGFIAKVTSVGTSECTASILPTGTTYQADGGAGGAGIGAGCTWYAYPSVPWITLASDPLTQGAGSLNYQVAANPGVEPRTASIQVAGNVLQILQKGSTNVVPFQDVAANDPFVDHIRMLKTNAVTSGCTATNYCPGDNTTRGQMAVFIVRSLLLTDDFQFPATPYFNDVPATHAQFKWIQKLRELNITTGCQALNFCPNDIVTRGQMAAFLVRGRFGTVFPFPTTPYFTDVSTNNVFFGFIQKLRQVGVTTGCSATEYCLNDPATRGQMAVFLSRMFLTPW
jgi:hypothetical protein